MFRLIRFVLVKIDFGWGFKHYI